jgi:ABC-2 type transport system ATP-binding protein
MITKLAAAGKAILISSHILTELAEMCDRVGIIEQGRLLAVGSVAEISAGSQVQSIVHVRVLEGADRLRNWLLARNDVSELRSDDTLAVFNYAGDRASEADLLRAMVNDGLPVVEFGAKHKSLEDVFLHVTEGRVQ